MWSSNKKTKAKLNKVKLLEQVEANKDKNLKYFSTLGLLKDLNIDKEAGFAMLYVFVDEVGHRKGVVTEQTEDGFTKLTLPQVASTVEKVEYLIKVIGIPNEEKTAINVWDFQINPSFKNDFEQFLLTTKQKLEDEEKNQSS